jgi:Caspase domain
MNGHTHGRFLIAAGTQNYGKLGDAWTLDSVPSDLDAITGLFSAPPHGYELALPELRNDPSSGPLLDGLQRWLTDEARSADDVAVVYYSGHGDVVESTFYLITANTEAGNYELTAFDVSRIVKLLREGSSVRRLLVIIDACYSGQGAHEIAEAVVRNARLLNFTNRGEGVWVVAAARPRQEARVENEFAHVFAAAVHYWQAETAPVQRYVGLETILDTVAEKLGATQQPYSTFVGVGGLAPFFPNPKYSDSVPVGVDLDTRRVVSRFQQELTEHWAAKVRGSDLAGHGGWYFTGRERALQDAAAFLTGDPRSVGSLRVVTGDPGSGKSAVLGRLVLHSQHVSAGGSIAALDDISLPDLRIDAALLARGKTVADLRQELAEVLDLPVGSDLTDAIATRPIPAVIVLDALDEAVEPHQVVANLIVPLLDAGRDSPGGARLLVGTRGHLLRSLPTDRDPIDLDQDEYLEPTDITRYVRKILAGQGDPDSPSPYRRDIELASEVAEEIGRIAGRSFLIAQIAARTLAAEPVAMTAEQVHASRSRWRDLAAAFDRDLERYGDRAAVVRDLLGALAWAEGAGLPRELWPVVANAIAELGAPYRDGDIGWLLENAGGYIVEAVEDERAVYRLYHQEFADHFRKRLDTRDTQRVITESLLNHVPRGPRGWRNWCCATLMMTMTASLSVTM